MFYFMTLFVPKQIGTLSGNLRDMDIPSEKEVQAKKSSGKGTIRLKVHIFYGKKVKSWRCIWNIYAEC